MRYPDDKISTVFGQDLLVSSEFIKEKLKAYIPYDTDKFCSLRLTNLTSYKNAKNIEVIETFSIADINHCGLQPANPDYHNKIIIVKTEDRYFGTICFGEEELTISICHEEDKDFFWSLNKNYDLRYKIDKPIISFLDEIITDSLDFINTCHNHDILVNRGLLFRGEPGNGKSLTCKFLKQLFLSQGKSVRVVNDAELQNAFRSDDLSTIFEYDLLIFDDIDVDVLRRKNSSKSDLAGAMLTELDGMHMYDKARVRIFSTNEDIEDVDPAFLRPGRIDSSFYFPPPTDEQSIKLIERMIPDNDVEVIKEVVNIIQPKNFSEVSFFANQYKVHSLLTKKNLCIKTFAETWNKNSIDDKEKKPFGFSA